MAVGWWLPQIYRWKTIAAERVDVPSYVLEELMS